jgi:hypothetical protein
MCWQRNTLIRNTQRERDVEQSVEMPQVRLGRGGVGSNPIAPTVVLSSVLGWDTARFRHSACHNFNSARVIFRSRKRV